MTECVAQLKLQFQSGQGVTVEFDAPEISSDAGVLILRQVDDQLALTRSLASLLPDNRDPSRIEHSRHEQLRQRVYQIALGYEDTNDANRLRHDPLLKVACDRNARCESGLSSQPTLCRLENAVSMREVKQCLEYLEDSWVEQLAADTEQVILDIDPTDAETHGAQQLSFFHGYYDQHMYHPLLIFDGQGQLVSAVLRPGNTHGARGAGAILERVIRKLKARLPQVQVVVRGDSAFGIARILAHVERLQEEFTGIDYLFGIAKNDALLALSKGAIDEAAERYRRTRHKVRHCTAVEYTAGSWPHARRVIVKAEHHAIGANPRFVVTSFEDIEPLFLYEAYCQRGQCENHIKDFKNALRADRLSCSKFVANWVRLLLHAAAYRLMFTLRCRAATVSPELGHQQFDTLRLRVLKVAALVKQSVRRVLIQLPRAYPWAATFRELLVATTATLSTA